MDCCPYHVDVKMLVIFQIVLFCVSDMVTLIVVKSYLIVWSGVNGSMCGLSLAFCVVRSTIYIVILNQHTNYRCVN